ncbi:MAG: PEP/pyruvate-binding domain-containing protein [Alphaproteobacteria bacterium]
MKYHQQRTKANTLNYLKSAMKSAKILDMVFFTVKNWTEERQICLEKINKALLECPSFIVRSSALGEDRPHESLAGKFKSILNVSKKDLKYAIEKVIISYGDTISLEDEVFVQPMLQDVTMSGVLFTKDPNSGSPYYIINYDLKGDTTAVTSGGVCSTFIVARCYQEVENLKFKRLIALAQELELKLNSSSLDIEFAFDKNADLFLFQVRPLIIKNRQEEIAQIGVLGAIRNKLENISAEHPYLYGKRTILGVMPDWNPAEIIGIRPKPLALSLYKELITDSTWAYQRDNYGYKNLRSFPLLIDLMGLPYIDVRVSFNSFIPKDLDPTIANKLVNYYLDRLEQEPFLHDKVEFEIVFSCYTFDLPDRIQALKEHDFCLEEVDLITQSLKNLTNNIIHSDCGLWLKDIEKIEELKKRHDLILSNHNFDELSKIYWLIEDCKRYGTLPFAGLARAGFIAVQLLNSMVAVGILNADERLQFLNSLDSVSTTMTQDLKRLDREHFLNKYGHLRPGTYDILSPRYDETPDIYFDWNNLKECPSHKKEEFKLSLSQMKKIENLLESHGLEHDVVGLLSFMKLAIEGRENAKFIFTKTLSDILSLLKQFSAKNSLELEDVAYLDIQKFLKLYSSSWDVFQEIKGIISSGKEKYKITSQINLPPLIVNKEDIEAFSIPDNRPNFVTRKSVTASVITDLSSSNHMNGAIVFIPSADPGFDWIFTHGIAGFVTAYGGVNSHMAIRAGELGLPAVIGSGEKLYNLWKLANKIYIDCANQRVEVLH